MEVRTKRSPYMDWRGAGARCRRYSHTHTDARKRAGARTRTAAPVTPQPPPPENAGRRAPRTAATPSVCLLTMPAAASLPPSGHEDRRARAAPATFWVSPPARHSTSGAPPPPPRPSTPTRVRRSVCRPWLSRCPGEITHRGGAACSSAAARAGKAAGFSAGTSLPPAGIVFSIFRYCNYKMRVRLGNHPSDDGVVIVVVVRADWFRVYFWPTGIQWNLDNSNVFFFWTTF